ncbi:hypothetical protein Riv7116_6816 [Rivularia sp. PCC 7116]|uniref:hypothetical protein n=1 Tax=Rivularia sp. PCC 7116 TaxID=373994 RepID=UPI00029F46F6|nr:hypothetical protein [Rivularia sp. PCC 7116]AFY59132.1 hypothetical protein Riv7116_6816 [Rivularia sp. PCC 7116]
MSKLLSATLIATSLLLGFNHNLDSAIAGTCASQCGTKPLQFTPGRRIRVQVVNKTPNPIYLEKPQGSNPILLRPGQQVRLEQGDGTEPNISVVFWNQDGLSLKANLSKPNFATLQVELRPEWRIGGDRGIYIRDDGRVQML